MKMKRQLGYALYLVVAVTAILFLLMSALAASYQSQKEALQAREETIRVDNLILSALTLWLTDKDLSQLDDEVYQLVMADGQVELRLITLGDELLIVNLYARLDHSDVNKEVQVTIDRDSGKILVWRMM